MSTSTQTIQAVIASLSPQRIGTYEKAVVVVGDVSLGALNLYDWNAQISGAFMAPLHICEVVMRNTVSDALTAVYGARWPWQSAFEQSLPSPQRGYNPRQDLLLNRGLHQTTGKVIPELKFVFWQKMFTSRYDVRLWIPHLRTVLPNLDPNKTLAQQRQQVYTDLENVRLLRNRIAHHEPIFRRHLAEDFDKIAALIGFRCELTADWMKHSQQVTKYLNRP